MYSQVWHWMEMSDNIYAVTALPPPRGKSPLYPLGTKTGLHAVENIKKSAPAENQTPILRWFNR
jgi:hypothetical protein